ncbi:MAG: SWIM zinc finger family protein [Armatimonadia bacterium]
MRSHWDDHYPKFPESKPLAADGGIKAHAQRGSFARNWWAKRWIAVLESFDLGARLGRGKRYARGGQVLSVDIDRGLVTAEVQGSRRKPYKVVVTVKALSHEEWAQVGERLASQAIFAARLLAGEMPQDIETVFAEAGLSLFPNPVSDLQTQCSCPDWSNPCKHIAAVYYLLGEEFDRDPFLIFRLRGMERDGLVELIGPAGLGVCEEPEPAPVLPEEPLPTSPPDFWHGEALPDDLFGEVRVPTVPAALPRRLGNFPFWRGETPLQAALEAIYPRASETGMQVFLPEGSAEDVPSAKTRR